jgi:hypothetical protein
MRALADDEIRAGIDRGVRKPVTSPRFSPTNVSSPFFTDVGPTLAAVEWTMTNQCSS